VPHGDSHHDHHHHHSGDLSDRRLVIAVVINVGLTVVQVIGGILSGSLALIADALHNFSDAASLVIAFAARRIGRRPADDKMTFGYGRAEIVAALINFTTLILIGLYLGYEAVMRLIEPQPIEGWTVVIIAGVALVIDAATAALTYTMSRESMNIKAAFLHNVADALASVAVIVGGVVVILWDWTLIDPLLTPLISGYVLWQGLAEIGGTIRILMLGTPDELDAGEVIAAVERDPGVADVHHIHLWRFDEQRISLEAHVVLAEGSDAAETKRRIRGTLSEEFKVHHVTLETECEGDTCQQEGGVAARA
jgi:cobalt-zinc-cadmium efflux system protein